MTEPEQDRLRDKLDEFSRRLDAHVRDWKQRGEFTDIHRSLTEAIMQRRDQLQKKLVSAEATGRAADLIKVELERDIGSLFDDLLQIGEKLDAAEMKGR